MLRKHLQSETVFRSDRNVFHVANGDLGGLPVVFQFRQIMAPHEFGSFPEIGYQMERIRRRGTIGRLLRAIVTGSSLGGVTEKAEEGRGGNDHVTQFEQGRN